MSFRYRFCHRTRFKVINPLLLFFSIFFLLNCTKQPDEETARSGQMTLSVDRQLVDIARIQTDMFSRYYPEAHIKCMPVSSTNSLKLLLEHSVRAALIEGQPDSAEDSLFAKQKLSLRREPIARDAIVCIVNSRNSAKTISLEELDSLFFARKKKGMTPIIEDDYRLHSLFAASIGKKRTNLSAWRCSSNTELIMRVSVDSNAVGLLFSSSLDRGLNDIEPNSAKKPHNTRVLPLSRKSGRAPAYLPTQQHIFEGNYPLVTTLYYVYYPGDALAAGFGAWLGREGQKAFERSSFAPCKLVERTIILK